MSAGATVDRRGCLRGLVGTGLGGAVSAWAAGPTAPWLVCVEHPAARTLAARWLPGVAPRSLPAADQASASAWQAWARRVEGRAVVAVLDDRAALLWEALLSPAARHTEHGLFRHAAAAPLHLLQQRF